MQMKEKKTKSKIYDSKVFWIAISLLCSLVIWWNVSGQESDEITMAFSGVKVEFTGEDELLEARNLSITNVDTSSVSIVVRGNRADIGGLRASDIKAVIDVSDITQANDMSWTYDIVFPDKIDRNDVSVRSRTPETINFTVIQNGKKTITVKGSFEGSVAEGCVAEERVFDPATITIEGPESALEQISYAWVTFGKDLEQEISSTYTESVGFTLMDENGQPCSTAGLQVSADHVTATQPVLKSKEVPLTVNLISGGGITSDDCTVSIEPSTITIAGDSRIIDGKNSIVLASIDLSSFQNSLSQTYTITLDDGIQNLTGVTEATVNVQIAESHTKVFTVSNISCKNVTSGYHAVIDTKELDVTLRAKSQSALDAVRPEDISIVVDLADYGATTGQVMASAKVYVSGHGSVGAIGDVRVTVTLTKT